MSSTKIYFLFTDTGTTLSRLINFFTKQSLNHVSISFDEKLTNVYSFGRKHPRNPFIGGFVREDVKGDFLRDANCAIYSLGITKEECDIILKNIREIEMNQHNYKYNFIGLLGVLFQIEIHRKYAYFCSQFVSRVMSDIDSFHIDKPHYFVTPLDVRNHDGMELIFQGKLKDYHFRDRIVKHPIEKLREKKSFILYITDIVRRFVFR